MTEYVFTPRAVPSVAVTGSSQRFPVHRIYCVGRNYADHAREMGTDPKTEPPVFFTKPPDAVTANDAEVPYPPGTSNFHHEIELVVAIGGAAIGAAGSHITAGAALDHVFGYAVGIDLTRRDLQPGDLIYTGTPAGVGPLRPGDRVEGGIDGLESLRNTIIAAA